MAEKTSCTVERLLAGFAQLSPEDQEKVRAALDARATGSQAGACCDPSAMMAKMRGTMKAAGCDSMTTCKEMTEQTQAGDRSAPPQNDRREGGS